MTQRTAAPAPGITHLICDCDGVLIDSEAVALRVLVQELQRCWPGSGVLAAVVPLLGLRIEQLLAQAGRICGRSLSAAEAEAIALRVEQASALAPPVAGVAEALLQINLPKACASNSHTARVREVLARNGLLPFFEDRLWCADRVGRPKPAPDVYVAAAAGFGVPCAACLVVEDSAAGAGAAVAAGMTVIGFAGASHVGADHAQALQRAGARCVIESMAALPGAVAQWAARPEGADMTGNFMQR